MAGRVVVLTGATGGVGGELARVFAGDRLVLLGRDAAKLTAMSCRYPGSRTVAVDLADPGTAGPAVNAALADGEGVDVLVHNAGLSARGPVADADAAGWSTVLAVNTVAPAVLTAALLPRLRAARGHVVFVGSGQSVAAAPLNSCYAASKFALRALADALRAEEADTGVRVSSLYPGRIATGMQRDLQDALGNPWDPAEHIDPATFAAAVRHVVDTPADAVVTELSLRPGPGPRRT